MRQGWVWYGNKEYVVEEEKIEIKIDEEIHLNLKKKYLVHF